VIGIGEDTDNTKLCIRDVEFMGAHNAINQVNDVTMFVCVKGVRCNDVLKAVEILLTSYRLR